MERLPLRAVAIAAVLIFVAAFTWLLSSDVGFVTTDTYTVLDGVPAIDRCIRTGIFEACGGVGRFPLFQYLPALAVKRLGGTYDDALRVLVALNGVALAGLLVLVWRLGRALRARYVGLALALGVVASPLLWYSDAGYGEEVAAFLIASYVYAVMTRASPLALGATVVLAGITKETAIVFLLAIAAVAHWGWRVRAEPGFTRAQLAAVSAGGAVAVALNIGFNLFRYGALTNPEYAQPGYTMPLHLVPEYLVGLMVSPTAGLVFMWPLVLVLLAVVVYCARRRTDGKLWRDPAIAIVALLVVLMCSLAAWHGPFGGSAWGSRLLTPWLPGLAMLAAVFYARELDSLLEGLVRSRAALAAGLAVVALIGLPHLSVTVDSAHHAHPYPGTTALPDEVAIAAYFPDRTCPRYPSTTGDNYYLHCLSHWTWTRGWAVADAYRALSRRNAPFYALLYLAALAGVGALLRRAHAFRPGTRACSAG